MPTIRTMWDIPAVDERLRYESPLAVDRTRAELRCERFPRSAYDALAGQIGPLANLRSSSGCALVLRTDSPWLVLRLASLRHHQVAPVGIDCSIEQGDGRLVRLHSADLRPEQGAVAVRFATGCERGGEPRTMRLHLPLISTCAIAGIRLTAGSVFEAAEPRTPRWLALGDSLTQGFVVQQPSQHWLALAAERLALPVRNLGVGGLGIVPEVFAPALAEGPYDLVSIGLGSNHAWRDGDPEQVAAAADRLVRLVLASGHRRVVWLEPPWKPLEDGQGPGEFMGVALDRRAAERLAVVRRELAAALAAHGDRVQLLRLATPHDHRRYPDGLHPQALGMAAVAEAFIASLG